MAKIETLVKDIHGLFVNAREPSEDLLYEFAERLKDKLRESFAKRIGSKGPKLRMSNIGLPSRKLWYLMHHKDEAAKPDPELGLKFLVGDVMEELILFLAKEAGHEPYDEGKYVEVDGVRGKLDLKLDNIPVDVKTASGASFKKFASGEFLLDDGGDSDPYGYKMQIAGYTEAEDAPSGAFLVFNKENAKLVVVKIDKEDQPDVHAKISQERENLERETPPERCFSDEPLGKSGNRVLGRICSWCEFKNKCWSDANDGNGLREHKYAYGTTYFTRVVREPNKKKDQVDDQVLDDNELKAVEGGFTVEE